MHNNNNNNNNDDDLTRSEKSAVRRENMRKKVDTMLNDADMKAIAMELLRPTLCPAPPSGSPPSGSPIEDLKADLAFANNQVQVLTKENAVLTNKNVAMEKLLAAYRKKEAAAATVAALGTRKTRSQAEGNEN